VVITEEKRFNQDLKAWENVLEQSVKGRMHQNGNGTVKSTKNLYLHKENGSLV
jgi:hypothetical protein